MQRRPAILVSRKERKGKAPAETSSGATRARSSRERGPAIAKPIHSSASERIDTPASGRRASNQRR